MPARPPQPCPGPQHRRSYAGGRGALTFHLTLHCGVRCTLVEPRRPAALSRQQHRDLAAAGVKAADFRLAQLRVRFGPELWRRGQQHAQASLAALEREGQRLLPAWEEAEDAEDDERGQQREGQAGASISTPTEAPADAPELRDEAEQLLRGCSLVSQGVPKISAAGDSPHASCAQVC